MTIRYSAGAHIRVELDLDVHSSYGPDWKLCDVHTQVEKEATQALENLIRDKSGFRLRGQVRVLHVSAVVHKEQS